MLTIAYLGLILFIASFEIIRKKANLFDFLTLFNLIFILLYPFPAFMLEANFENSTPQLMFGHDSYQTNIQAALAVFAGYFLVIAGFYSKSAERSGRNIIIKSSQAKTVLIFSICLLVFSCASIQIYGSQYGNVVTALSKSMLIRSNAVESGSLVFFKNFIPFVFFASYMLAAFVFFKQNCQRFIYLLFVTSLTVSFIAALLIAGRQALVNYFLNFYLAYVVKTKEMMWGVVLVSIYFIGIFILYGKHIFFSLTALPEGFDAVVNKFIYSINSPAGSDFSFYELLANFMYPIHSLDAAFTAQYQWRLFVDWFYGIGALIPEKLTGIVVPKTLTEFNTDYLVNANHFSVQPALLGFAIYSMSWPGLVIVCFSYGWIGRCLQAMADKHIDSIIWMPFLYVIMLQVWIDFQVLGDPGMFLNVHFWSITSTFFLLFFISKTSFNFRNNHKQY